MTNKNSPIILGMVYGAHDTAAALMVGGELVAACEQERCNLEKHTRAFPNEAIAECLARGGYTLSDVDEIAFCNDPMHYIRETYLKLALEEDYRIGVMIDDFHRIKRAYQMEELVRKETGFEGPIKFHLHHMCHVASAYYPSGFDDALLACYDGMGEIQTGLLAGGKDGDIEVLDASGRYPHSLGLLYSGITHFLGFKHHCDEGIVMGLAPYGDADAISPDGARTYYEVFEDIVQETGDYSYEVNLDWFVYHKVRDIWISDKFTDLFGPVRKWEDEITGVHKNVAAALQRRLEVIVLNQLRRAREEFGYRKLALSGGVALNCSMNGKIAASGIFDEIFVQPASGDSGTAIGACYLSHKRMTPQFKPKKCHNFYLGTASGDDVRASAEAETGVHLQKQDNIYEFTAKRLAEGKIIAWFQDGAEFGPRALGNRSILTRPYPAEMKDYLNERVKFREPFRPFAPAILSDHLEEYFDIRQESPHMLIACQVQ
ncbi:MAG: carbamoyltransferase N-terminal domain-containing protein, partial [Pseudomonadota bacterium]|nr:carbamoyltransferase N-terminal domain-containing protein [Pseudomonadota bacterium]